MNIDLLTEIIAIVVPAVISIAASISACVSAFKGIKSAEGRIVAANSATNLGKLKKAVEENAELNRGLSLENSKLIADVRDVIADNRKLIEATKGKENEYSILADRTKEMMSFIESYKAQSQADHDEVVKIVNSGKRQLLEAYITFEEQQKALKEENEALRYDLKMMNKKLDEFIANRRAR